MAILRFKTAQVRAEVERCKQGTQWQAPYGGTGEGKPGLWLVGDQGVYLMGNDAERKPKENRPVYAVGIDPDIDEDWYDEKVDTFGGDDGVDDFDIDEMIEPWLIAAEVTGREFVEAEITEENVQLIT